MLKYIAIALALTMPAFAQEQAPATLDQRIGSQIGALVIQNAGLQMQLEQVQSALKAAQDQVKALQDKYEPKPAPAK